MRIHVNIIFLSLFDVSACLNVSLVPTIQRIQDPYHRMVLIFQIRAKKFAAGESCKATLAVKLE